MWERWGRRNGRDRTAEDRTAEDRAATERAADARAEVARAESQSSELRERIAAQWAELRAARRAMDAQPEIAGGPSNLQAGRVPYGVDLAAAWSWRFLVIAATLAVVLYLLNLFLVVVLPLVIALLLAALVSPVVGWLQRLGLARKPAALVVVVLGVALISLMFTFVGNQVSSGVSDLSSQVDSGIGQIRDWLREGPLKLSDSQLSSALDQAQAQLREKSQDAVGAVTEVGTALGHILAGAFIVLFATYFFLADGTVIWAWMVRLFPRAGRVQADSSGRVAWRSLTQFVRATVMVAATDAIGVMIGAVALGVPFVSAIGVLVFIGAFVPLVGAFVSGTVAVLVALVTQGPVTALIMFGVIVAVQQLEAHVLQPFLMGRFVSVHPLGVIVAIALGVLVAGIPGALVAVPLVASVNAVAQHLASGTAVGQSPEPVDRDVEDVVDDGDGEEDAQEPVRQAAAAEPGSSERPPD